MKKMTAIKQFFFLASALLFCNAIFAGCIGVANMSGNDISVEFFPNDFGEMPVLARSCTNAQEFDEANSVTIANTNNSIKNVAPGSTVIWDGSTWSRYTAAPFACACPPPNQKKVKGKS